MALNIYVDAQFLCCAVQSSDSLQPVSRWHCSNLMPLSQDSIPGHSEWKKLLILESRVSCLKETKPGNFSKVLACWLPTWAAWVHACLWLPSTCTGSRVSGLRLGHCIFSSVFYQGPPELPGFEGWRYCPPLLLLASVEGRRKKHWNRVKP